MRIQTGLLLAGLLLSPMVWAHGGHEPVLFQGWRGWNHWLAHALAAPAVAFGIGVVVAGAALWLRLGVGRTGFFGRRADRNSG